MTDTNNLTLETLDERQFIASCFGRNDLGEANSQISASIISYRGTKEGLENELNYQEVASRYTKQGEFYLEVHGDFVQVDMKFNTYVDPELRLLWNLLEQYGKERNNVDTGGVLEEQVLLVFNVVPDEYGLQFYMSFMNPVFWVLQPSSADEEACNMIRMLVHADNFNINEIPQEIDVNAALAESQRIYNTILHEKA